MKRSDPPSDRDIAEAFLALDRTIPDGHLEDFSSRVLAQLDESQEIGDMDARELARGSGLRRPDEAALGAANADAPRTVRDEHSGLHEIKALATTTKRRISQRITSESEAEESLLVGASSGSFRTAALPDPARQKAAAIDSADEQVIERTRGRLADRPVARPASEVDSRPLPSRASAAPFWILGAVAATAAAAAVAVFVFGIGREKDKETGTAIVAQAEQAPAEQAPAAPAPEMRFAEPPPPADPSAGAAAPASTPMIATLESERSDEGTRSSSGAPKGRALRESRSDKAEDSKRAGDKVDTARQEKKSPVQKSGGGKDLNDVLDQVTGGVEAPAKVEEEGPKKPSKKGLDRRDVSKAMDAVRGSVMRCRDAEQFEGTITVKFIVAPSGAVTSVAATGGKKGTRTGDCVAGAVKRARFPAFDGAPTSFTYPFLLAE